LTESVVAGLNLLVLHVLWYNEFGIQIDPKIVPREAIKQVTVDLTATCKDVITRLLESTIREIAGGSIRFQCSGP
jgi:hypothetical protein